MFSVIEMANFKREKILMEIETSVMPGLMEINGNKQGPTMGGGGE